MIQPSRRALRPVATYVATALVWILVSDWVLTRLLHGTPSLGLASVVKGWGFVAVTAVLLYGVIGRDYRLLYRAEQQARATNRTLRALSSVHRLVTQRQDAHQLLQEACQTILKDPSCSAAWIGVAGESGDSLTLVAWAGPAGLPAPPVPNPDPTGPAWRALHTRKAHTMTLAGTGDEDPWRRHLLQAGVTHAAAFPLKEQGRLYGVLTVYTGDSELFTGERYRILSEIADALALGLRLLSAERSLAESERLLALQMARLEAITGRDPLTGLCNRQRFERLLAEEVDRSRGAGRPFAVVVFDLERFGEINARLGHDAADRVLAEIGLRLQEAFRPTERIGRVGGDAFAVILPGVTAREGRSVAEQLVQDVPRWARTAAGEQVPVRITAAVVAYPEHGRSHAELEAAMDSALLQSRSASDGIAVFDQTSHSLRLHSFGQGDMLRRALKDGRLRPAFQPVVDLGTGEVYGYELLARVVLGERLVTASEFIREAEEYGLLGEVDERILEWVADGWKLPVFQGKRLFINLSPDLVSRPAYRERVIRLLEGQPDLARVTVWELTERHSLEDDEATARFFANLKLLGAQLALDDFGSGYSSLGYFRRLVVDYVKIDGSLVRGVAHSVLDERLVAAIRRVAGELGAHTIAEAVETEEVARAVRAMGVRFGQGYYLGMPVLLEQLPGVQSPHTLSTRSSSGPGEPRPSRLDVPT
ncbi:MAG: EAL domain-containing protein [Limnochordaceae bacterium]|nr:EAL domain-containing protein [Limnochordaceae bacterium]